MAEITSLNEKVSLQGRFAAMPAFYLPKEKKSLPLSAWIGIISVVIFIAVIVVFVLLYTATSEPVALPQVQPQPLATEQAQPEPIESVQPAPEPSAPVTPQPAPSRLPAAAIGLFAKDTDTDQDALTDIEERIFLTSSAVPDTDQDSFIDGMEVKNLYDPATPGALLEVSPQVKTVRNDAFGYQLLIPAAWTATKLTPQGDQFQIKPEQGSEAFIIHIFENMDRANVTSWYQSNAIRPDLTQFVDFKNEGGWNGIQSTDHTYVIAAYGQDEPGARALIFVMVYDAGEEEILRYPTVWDMMANSLSIASAQSATP